MYGEERIDLPRLLERAFSAAELAYLQAQSSFVDGMRDVKTTLDFQDLCDLGTRLLEQSDSPHKSPGA